MKYNARLYYPPDVKIQDIIDSLYHYALRDIRVNIDNPIAAFILGSCFIDQMAAFRYDPPRNKIGEHYKKFISEYLQHLEPLDLYTNLRCNLVHGYSISDVFALSSEPPAADTSNHIHANNLSVTNFLKELTIAFGKFAHDIKYNQDAQKNALSRHDKFPPLIGVSRANLEYEEIAADYLVNHFTKTENLIGQPINGKSNFPITSIIKVPHNGKFLIKCLSQNGAATYEAYLEEITQQLGKDYPTVVLKEAGLYEGNILPPDYKKG